jgi:hypothetical protein
MTVEVGGLIATYHPEGRQLVQASEPMKFILQS